MTQRGARRDFQEMLRAGGVEVVQFDFLTPEAVAAYCQERGFLQVCLLPKQPASHSVVVTDLLWHLWLQHTLLEIHHSLTGSNRVMVFYMPSAGALGVRRHIGRACYCSGGHTQSPSIFCSKAGAPPPALCSQSHSYALPDIKILHMSLMLLHRAVGTVKSVVLV